MIGTTLHHYRIVRELGSGGMGEIYVAEDTRLHREVALKLLPREMAADPERLRRFQREAQVIAALNHPNIVTIYAVEEAENVHYITMELVEGKTLTELIPERGFPVQEFLRLAVQIADAVSAAHQRGIVHRDLKPANIMVTAGGQVKVLDFGFAKLKRERPGPADATTVTTDPLTVQSGIFGTPDYMSPEQAQGLPVDQRTDIFSLGVIMYEMATGTLPFRGGSAVNILSSVIKDDPLPVVDVNPRLPRELSDIIMRCLAKDPAHRYQSAQELNLDLERLEDKEVSEAGLLDAAVRVLARKIRRERRWVAGLLMILLMAVGSYILLRSIRRSQNPAPPTAENFRQITTTPGVEQFPSLSPDGQWIAYSCQESGHRRIYLQNISGENMPPIAIPTKQEPDVDDDEPVFSPDGEQIAFRSSRDGGGIFVMSRTGEAVRQITRTGFNPRWSPDSEEIVFATENTQLEPLNWEGTSEVWAVDLHTGTLQILNREDAVQPAWSPHNRRIAYAKRNRSSADRRIADTKGSMKGSGPAQFLNIWTMSTSGTDHVAVTTGGIAEWSPVWSKDGTYLYFASDRVGSMNLWRVPMDESTGRPTGEPEAIMTPASYLGHPGISSDGKHIAYVNKFETQNIQRIPFDPVTAKVTGEPEWITKGSRLWSSPDVSPDGQWLVFYSRSPPEGQIYVQRTDGTGLMQLTSETGVGRVPRWSLPRGDWIAFNSRDPVKDRSQIWMIHPDASGFRQASFAEDGISYPVWSPDGERIAGNSRHAGKTIIFYPKRSWQEQSPQELPAPGKELGNPAVNSWSPDGIRLALQMSIVGGGSNTSLGIVTYSFETGEYERLTDYGEWPVWLNDSQRLLFVSKGSYFFVIDSRTKAATKIFTEERDSIGFPRIPGDESYIYFTRRRSEADIWMMDLR
jgi:serine/threonine protein kinase